MPETACRPLIEIAVPGRDSERGLKHNGRALAEYAGDISPDGMQRLLRKAYWDAGAVRYELQCNMASISGVPRQCRSWMTTGLPRRAPDRPRLRIWPPPAHRSRQRTSQCSGPLNTVTWESLDLASSGQCDQCQT